IHDVTHYKRPDGTPFPAEDCPGLQVLQEGTELREQFDEFIRRDGSFFPVVYSSSPLKQGDEIVGVVVAFRDDTERRRAEQALREGEDRLRTATQAAKMFAFEWDVATGAIVRSEAVPEVLGAREETNTTIQHVFSSVHPEDRESVTAAIDNLSPDNPFLRIRHRMMSSDGSAIWVDRTSRGYFDEHGKLLRVVGMVMDITEHKQAEEAQRRTELQYQELVATIDAIVWRCDDPKVFQFTFVSSQAEKILGYPLERWTNEPSFWPDHMHPDDRSWAPAFCIKAVEERRPHDFQYRMIAADGRIVWFHDLVRVIEYESEVKSLTGIMIDITQQKQTEEELRDFGRRLIEAQEEERTRIARELHDDIGQRLAVLTMSLELAKKRAQGSTNDVLEKLRQETAQIASDTQALSHGLHSPSLDYLGIAVAMKRFCEDFSQKQDVEITFQHTDVPKTVPREISLCLYRILQEAVHNAAKHSEQKRIEVQLHCADGEIHLDVCDSGKGFDLVTAGRGRGIGLMSMQERVQSIGGTLSIESQPQVGTKVHARVPLTIADVSGDSMDAAD
ncbi:MAG: PAS domain S-box protein, partial [Candidatus Korobacteraceae bacterium]